MKQPITNEAFYKYLISNRSIPEVKDIAKDLWISKAWVVKHLNRLIKKQKIERIEKWKYRFINKYYSVKKPRTEINMLIDENRKLEDMNIELESSNIDLRKSNENIRRFWRDEQARNEKLSNLIQNYIDENNKLENKITIYWTIIFIITAIVLGLFIKIVF